MNRECEFEEWKEILKSAYLEYQAHPFIKLKRLQKFRFYKYDDTKNLDKYLKSEAFERFSMEEYQKLLKLALLERRWFTLVDALEQFTNTAYFGKNFLKVPDNNVYVPPRQYVMKRPDLYDDAHDEVSYQFNMKRVSPYHYLNTLKGHKLNAFVEP